MRNKKSVAAFAVVCSLLVGPATALAQQASIIGTVTDETKGVVPGVTVTATNQANGLQTVSVTTERGEYRLQNLQPGVYRVSAELVGFASTIVEKIELLLGQSVALPLALKLGDVSEQITVTGETPLVDTVSTRVAGNIDPRQMESAPILGGNWMELAKNVKGITANSISNIPVRNESIQLNLDGQQVTTKLAAFQQGKLSRESIAEFQVVTNLFDVTQGRSDGLQVNAISRSGTNETRASVYGFFRDDALNAPDALTKTVLPYENQQLGGSLGGPIRRNKAHYFLSTEYEREPGTVVARPEALPGHEYVYPKEDSQITTLSRVDYQVSSRDRLTFRVSTWDQDLTPTSNGHPSTARAREFKTRNLLATWARVSNNKVQELKLGYYNISWGDSITVLPTSFEYSFPGLLLGKGNAGPQFGRQYDPSARYDLTWNRGRHDLKIGGEFIYSMYRYLIPTYREGQFVFSQLPNDIGTRIPVEYPFDISKWDLSGLESSVLLFQKAFDPQDFNYDREHPTWATWIGDTWRVSDQLTINYGVRWDVIWNTIGFSDTVENVILIDNGSSAATTNIPGMGPGDFGYKKGGQDFKNISPRGGFSWNVGGSNTFVVRGGTGIYFTQLIGDITNQQKKGSRWINNAYRNDGLPGFFEDPTRGIYTFEQAAAAPRQPQVGTIISENFKVPYTWQQSIGFQKQFGEATGIDMDLVHYNMYRDTLTINPLLLYDPVTGYNKNPATAGTANPEWAQITYYVSTGRQDYTALLTGFNRRLKNGVQGGVTHTWVLSSHDTNARSFGDPPANNQFDYLDGEYARSSVQDHTLRGWMSAELPWGIQTSLQYSFGSGGYVNATINSNPYNKRGQNRLNLLNNGNPAPAIIIPEAARDRFDGPDVIESGTVIPRNALKQFTFQQVDIRLAKQVDLPGSMSVSLMAEVFNLFDRANYSNVSSLLSPTSAATTARFGQPTAASIPRTGQLGFRLAWR